MWGASREGYLWITARTNTEEILLLKKQEKISSVFILRVMATGSAY